MSVVRSGSSARCEARSQPCVTRMKGGVLLPTGRSESLTMMSMSVWSDEANRCRTPCPVNSRSPTHQAEQEKDRPRCAAGTHRPAQRHRVARRLDLEWNDTNVDHKQSFVQVAIQKPAITSLPTVPRSRFGKMFKIRRKNPIGSAGFGRRVG